MSDTVHAGCVLLGEAGILIVGKSGAGKSALARVLVQSTLVGCGYAAIVSDDRTRLERQGDQIVARSHPLIAGQLEIRGIGIIAIPGENAAVLRLVVELAAEAPERMPGRATASLLGVVLPRLKLDSRSGAVENADLVRIYLSSATQI